MVDVSIYFGGYVVGDDYASKRVNANLFLSVRLIEVPRSREQSTRLDDPIRVIESVVDTPSSVEQGFKATK